MSRELERADIVAAPFSDRNVLRSHTPARVALRTAGTSLATSEILDLNLCLAEARDALHACLAPCRAALQHDLDECGDTLRQCVQGCGEGGEASR